jgi:hypothetical protein
VLVVYGKDEGFCGDSGAAEAFAECFVCGLVAEVVRRERRV